MIHKAVRIMILYLRLQEFIKGQNVGCGESIKEFLTLGFWGSVLGVSVFVTSNDLINGGYKTDGV